MSINYRKELMKTIWKFILQPECKVEMPAGAELLSVNAIGDDICLWAKVDPAAPKVSRSFVAFGTGHDVPDESLAFVGTALMLGGALVFHIFERR